ncbi:MAG TPA: hypothetical protein VM491_18535 [Burkholderiaceae bacterium]|jgi:hypothetical protein|nr:hypothetical protein [Burkholderiaceae bacterium]
MDGWWLLVVVPLLLALWGVGVLALLRYCNATFVHPPPHASPDPPDERAEQADSPQGRARSGRA